MNHSQQWSWNLNNWFSPHRQTQYNNSIVPSRCFEKMVISLKFLVLSSALLIICSTKRCNQAWYALPHTCFADMARDLTQSVAVSIWCTNGGSVNCKTSVMPGLSEDWQISWGRWVVVQVSGIRHFVCFYQGVNSKNMLRINNYIPVKGSIEVPDHNNPGWVQRYRRNMQNI